MKNLKKGMYILCRTHGKCVFIIYITKKTPTDISFIRVCKLSAKCNRQWESSKEIISLLWNHERVQSSLGVHLTLADFSSGETPLPRSIPFFIIRKKDMEPFLNERREELDNAVSHIIKERDVFLRATKEMGVFPEKTKE